MTIVTGIGDGTSPYVESCFNDSYKGGMSQFKFFILVMSSAQEVRREPIKEARAAMQI